MKKKLMIAIWVTILVGGAFRFWHLGQKIYWVDEVASSLRVAGITSEDLTRNFVALEERPTTAVDLRAQVKPNPHTNISDVVHSLVVEDAQHPPLIPILQYEWSRIFGAEPAALRALSAVFGILAMICVYWLSLELFDNRLAASAATMVFAISPFQLIYSQQAREYSAWVMMIALSSALFAKALRRNRLLDWALYNVSLVFAFYTYITSAFIVLAHGFFFVITRKESSKDKKTKFILASVIAGILWLPWIRVIFVEIQQVIKSNGNFGLQPTRLEYLLMLFINLGRNFVDFGTWSAWDRPFHAGPNFILILVGAGLSILGAFALWPAKNQSKEKLQLVLLASVYFFPWFITDLWFGHFKGAVPRYLMPCWMSIDIGLGLLTAHWSRSTRKFYRAASVIVVATLILLGGLSWKTYFTTRDWWTTRPPQFGADLRDLPKTQTPLPILANSHAGWTLISLAFFVPDKTIFVLSDGSTSNINIGTRFLLFLPTEELLTKLAKSYRIVKVGSGKYLYLAEKNI